MDSEGEKYRFYSRRAALLAGAQGLLVTALAGRMYYLGVVESSEYKTLADENRLSLRLLAPDRGEILDRSGRELATNRRDYRVFLVPEQAKNVAKTLHSLGRIITLSESDQRRVERQIARQRSFLPVTVAENLDWDTFARVNVASPSLPGVQSGMGNTRLYPDGPLLSHVVGYVGAVTEEEVGNDPVLELPGFKTGKSGLERAFESRLRGEAGSSRVEVNAYGRVIREVQRQEGRPGENMVLTLDIALQKYAAERLGEESAAAIVMDVHNGELLAMASTPAYDPNQFNFGISRENWEALVRDPRKPLVNKCVAGQYPPGSTFKMIVALAGLEAGLIDPETEHYCSGRHRFGDRTFHCWRPQGHGNLGLVDAIARSCDIYFYKIAIEIGIDRISEMARQFGLGSAYGLEIPGEARGLVPSKEWKMALDGVPWQAGETLVLGIGQGALLASPVQLAVMTSRIANGGRAVIPRIVHTVGQDIAPQQTAAPLMRVSDDNMAVVRRGMEKVLEEKGTAYLSRLRGEGISMAGKTGTSQVRRISKAERDTRVLKTKERPWQERDHAVFVGYGPIENPKYAVSILVEHGGGGSTVAAPIARDILRRTLELDPSANPPVRPADLLRQRVAAL